MCSCINWSNACTFQNVPSDTRSCLITPPLVKVKADIRPGMVCTHPKHIASYRVSLHHSSHLMSHLMSQRLPQLDHSLPSPFTHSYLLKALRCLYFHRKEMGTLLLLYWEWLAPNNECIWGGENPQPNKRWPGVKTHEGVCYFTK